jgi:hypothetical protein
MSARPLSVREVELAFAAEAAAHARAASELNPFGEAESLELGEARAVYSGAWSPVHGVFGLGLDGPVEERDLAEVFRFFHKKERPPAFWVTPETDPSLLLLLGRDFQATRKMPVHAATPAQVDLPPPSGSHQPDHQAWTLAFTRTLDPGAVEAGLLALTKLHQKDTRFYLGAQAASYTFFHRGLALVPTLAEHSLLALQASDAKEWGAAFLATGAASPLPFLYERTLYERL